MSRPCAIVALLLASSASTACAFAPPVPAAARTAALSASTAPAESAAASGGTWVDNVVTAVVDSPLYPLLLRGARSTIKTQVARLGVKWDEVIAERMASVDWEAEVDRVRATRPDIKVPEYYLRKFHAYGDGNLCLDAALEQDLASLAVGVHSFPAEGAQAERKLRDSYAACLAELGAAVPTGAQIVDLACGTGISTVDLARRYPQAARVVGIDLSPHMVAVGQRLLADRARELALKPRVALIYGDAAEPLFPAESVDLVNLGFILHELPNVARRAVFSEALRMLKPGGTLAMMDMDPEGPDSQRVRSNVVLFSILKSTEPYLDQYFGAAPGLRGELLSTGFALAREAAVSPRLKAVVALKAGETDLRGEAPSRARRGGAK